MRRLCFMFACLFGSSLLAETTGTVEFQFPPSAYDWVLLTDTTQYPASDNVVLPFQMKIYTHKVGDVLEFFSVVSMDTPADEEDDEDEMETAEFTQSVINQMLAGYFPNHKIAILNQVDNDETAFIEWEMNDGVQPILYGLARGFQLTEKSVALSYMTTASKSLENTALWTSVLEEASM